MKFIGILTAFSLMSGTAHAQFLSEGTVTQFSAIGDYFGGGADSRGHIYVLPNELNPEIAVDIFKGAPEGVYVTVGAERGLLAATLAPNVTHLLQVDLVPEVVRYNQLNVILLKVAESLPDLLSLRTAPRSVWLDRSKSDRLNSREKALLASEESHKFYLEVEGGARERLVHPDYFKGSSYLKSPELFARAQSLARGNRIQVAQGNLTDFPRLKGLAQDLASRGLKISILDLSNAWEEKYVGPRGVNEILNSLKTALKPESVVLGTSVSQCIVSHLCFWNFRAYSLRALEAAQKLVAGGFSLGELFKKKRTPAPNLLHTDVETVRAFVPISSSAQIGSCKAAF